MHDDLAELLARRREIIADHAFRDRDTMGHLEALKEISEKISSWHETNREDISGRLNHFLTNSSYDKAQQFLDSGGTWTGH